MRISVLHSTDVRYCPNCGVVEDEPVCSKCDAKTSAAYQCDICGTTTDRKWILNHYATHFVGYKPLSLLSSNLRREVEKLTSASKETV